MMNHQQQLDSEVDNAKFWVAKLKQARREYRNKPTARRLRILGECLARASISRRNIKRLIE